MTLNIVYRGTEGFCVSHNVKICREREHFYSISNKPRNIFSAESIYLYLVPIPIFDFMYVLVFLYLNLERAERHRH